MGFFKDIRTLSKMGKEQQKKMDVAGSMAQMKSTLDALVTQPIADGAGVQASATVVSARDTGAQLNMQQVVEVELTVLLPSGVPVPVTRTMPVSPLHAARLQPGSQVDVRLDPAAPADTLVVLF